MELLLAMDVQCLADTAAFAAGLSRLCAERRAKTENCRTAEAARLSLGAGLLLQIAAERQGLSLSALRIQTGAHGKPYLADGLFCFSLSHSGTYAVCAVSPQNIGVDVQKTQIRLPKRPERILAPAEIAYLDALPQAEQTAVFARFWARKESLIKWDGRGLRLPMAEVSFVREGRVCDTAVWAGRTLRFREIPFHAGYALCVCGETLFSAEIEKITPEKLVND